MALGFSFRQSMSGTYWLLDAPTDERAIAFAIRAETRDLRALARQTTLRATGRIDADRLASGQPVEGTLALRLLDGRRLAYRLGFRRDDGRACELSGLEEWSQLSPVESLTVLRASLYDDRGEEFARATLRFDVRSQWASLLKSIRLYWAW
ncbi:MAG TPA: hypothetical protein VE987_04230 [Polyangiaceae bacterium]|nr:hypothetical protein [Polyangiaceae bacterium]